MGALLSPWAGKPSVLFLMASSFIVGSTAPPRLRGCLSLVISKPQGLIPSEGAHSSQEAPWPHGFPSVEEGENALAEMNDSGFNSDPTSILAKTKTSLEGLKRGTEAGQAGLPRGGRADKPGPLEHGMF